MIHDGSERRLNWQANQQEASNFLVPHQHQKAGDVTKAWQKRRLCQLHNSNWLLLIDSKVDINWAQSPVAEVRNNDNLIISAEIGQYTTQQSAELCQRLELKLSKVLHNPLGPTIHMNFPNMNHLFRTGTVHNSARYRNKLKLEYVFKTSVFHSFILAYE